MMTMDVLTIQISLSLQSAVTFLLLVYKVKLIFIALLELKLKYSCISNCIECSYRDVFWEVKG